MRHLFGSKLIWGLISGLVVGYLTSRVVGYPWDRAPWSGYGAIIGLFASLVLDSPARRAALARVAAAAWFRFKSRRTWVRFSLRSLLVVLTLLCFAGGWTARQLNWIRERRAFLAELPTSDEFIDIMRQSSMPPPTAITSVTIRLHGGAIFPRPSNLPWQLKPFGEAEVYYFVFNKEGPPSPEWLRRANELFPEAEINILPTVLQCGTGTYWRGP